MVGDTGEFSHDHAQIFSALRRFPFGSHQLLDSQHVAEVVRHAGQVVQAVGVGDVCEPGVALTDFFVIAVQISAFRLQTNDCFAVQSDDHAEDAMGGGVLRPHIDDDAVGLDMAG